MLMGSLWGWSSSTNARKSYGGVDGLNSFDNSVPATARYNAVYTKTTRCMNTALNLSNTIPNYAIMLIHMLKVVWKTFNDNHQPKYSTVKIHKTLVIK